MKKTKLVSSTFHNFTMNTEQLKAIYATGSCAEDTPTAQLHVLKESQTLTGECGTGEIKPESKHHLILVSPFSQSLGSYRNAGQRDQRVGDLGCGTPSDWLLRAYHKAWITLKNCACYNGRQITTLRSLPCQALQHWTSLLPSPGLFLKCGHRMKRPAIRLAPVNGGSLDPRTQLSDFKASAMDQAADRARKDPLPTPVEWLVEWSAWEPQEEGSGNALCQALRSRWINSFHLYGAKSEVNRTMKSTHKHKQDERLVWVFWDKSEHWCEVSNFTVWCQFLLPPTWNSMLATRTTQKLRT